MGISCRIRLISFIAITVSGIIMLKSYQSLLASEEQRTVHRMTAEGNLLADNEGYSNEGVKVISKLVEEHQFQDVKIGVWRVEESNPYGTLFMFQIALDYFRVCAPQEVGKTWQQTKMITQESELNGFEYVVSGKSLDILNDRGYESIYDKGWIHLYQLRKEDAQ